MSISTPILITLDCRNNVVIFNFEFYNVDQRRNKVVNMIIFKKLKKAKKDFWPSNKRWFRWLTTLAFDCDRNMELTKKGKHGTYNVKINFGKYKVWYWKEYKNNSISLLMAK